MARKKSDTSAPDAVAAPPRTDSALIAFVNEQIAHWTEERRALNPAARYYVDAFRQVRTRLGE